MNNTYSYFFYLVIAISLTTGCEKQTKTAVDIMNYEWRREEFPEKGMPEGEQIGVIAQQLQEVFPEMVKVGEDGYLRVAYSKLIPILVASIQEQQKRIDELSTKLESGSQLKSELERHQELMEFQGQLLDQMRVENENLKKDMMQIKKELGIDLKASTK